jgi:hypothetical protein
MSFPMILLYAALALLAVGFALPTMMRLRGLGLAAGVAVLAWGLATSDYLAAVLGLAIAAVNAWRLYELQRLTGVTREATASSAAPVTVDWLLPYMRPMALPKDTIVFHKGAAADAMYFVEHGRVRFEEVDVEMGKGSLFGEIGVFSHNKSRTATAKCVEDCSLLQISADKVHELYYKNPAFGFFIVDLITRRLMEDAAAGKLRP